MNYKLSQNILLLWFLRNSCRVEKKVIFFYRDISYISEHYQPLDFTRTVFQFAFVVVAAQTHSLPPKVAHLLYRWLMEHQAKDLQEIFRRCGFDSITLHIDIPYSILKCYRRLLQTPLVNLAILNWIYVILIAT